MGIRWKRAFHRENITEGESAYEGAGMVQTNMHPGSVAKPHPQVAQCIVRGNGLDAAGKQISVPRLIGCQTIKETLGN